MDRMIDLLPFVQNVTAAHHLRDAAYRKELELVEASSSLFRLGQPDLYYEVMKAKLITDQAIDQVAACWQLLRGAIRYNAELLVRQRLAQQWSQANTIGGRLSQA